MTTEVAVQRWRQQMERIECEIVVNRPAEVIFAYLSDANNWPEWNSLVLEAHADETPLRKGSKVETVVKVLGQRIVPVSEITEHEVLNEGEEYWLDVP